MSILPDLSQRNLQAEVMDQPGLDPLRHEQALAGLRRINSFSSSGHLLWPAIRKLARQTGTNSLRILDVASGGGDVPIALWQLGRRHGLRLTIVGCDVSPLAVEHAGRQARAAGSDIMFRVSDVLHERLPDDFDVITCSLFLHHLRSDEAVDLLRRMTLAAGRMVVVNDLRRSLAGYLLAQVACRLLTTSPVVRIDGPRSLANAFTATEMGAMCAAAGLQGAIIQRRWPCRMLVTWHHPR